MSWSKHCRQCQHRGDNHCGIYSTRCQTEVLNGGTPGSFIQVDKPVVDDSFGELDMITEDFEARMDRLHGVISAKEVDNG